MRFFQNIFKARQGTFKSVSSYFKNKTKDSEDSLKPPQTEDKGSQDSFKLLQKQNTRVLLDSFKLLQKQDKIFSRFFQTTSKNNHKWCPRFFKNKTWDPQDSFKLVQKQDKGFPLFFQSILKTNHKWCPGFFQIT